MASVRSVLDELSYFWRWRSTFRGLVATLLGLNLVVLPSILSVSYFVLDRAKAIPTSDAFFTFVASSAAFVAILNLLAGAVWLYWRRLPVVSVGRVGIIFSPQPHPGAEDLVHTLYQQFVRDVEAHALGSLITHTLLPYDKPVKNHDDAIITLAKSKANIIIFGSYTSGTVAGREKEGFETLSFSLRHPPLMEQQVLPLLETLAGAMALRSYVISNDNSFIERRVVVQNLSEVARFFIAVGLTLEGKAQRAISLLDELLADVEAKKTQHAENPQLDFFRSSITRALHAALMMQFHEAYEREFLPYISTQRGNVAADRVHALIRRLAAVSGDPDLWLLSTAVLHFHRGDIREAIGAVQKAQHRIAPSDPAPHLSLAFLALWEGRYRDALRHYGRARRGQVRDVSMMTSVLSFLESVAEHNPEKVQVRYGLAVVNDAFFDQSAAMREYEEFLRMSGQDPTFAALRDHAASRLDALRKAGGT